MKSCSERSSQIVRMAFALLSSAWWIVFLVGFGMLLTAIKKEAEEMAGDDFVEKTVKPLVKIFTAPFWMLLVAGALLYITYTLQVFKTSENAGHILHCITVFFNFFYTSSAILTIFTAAMYEAQGTHDFLKLVLPRAVAVKTIMIGSTVSVITFWVGLGVWPLLNIRRSRYRGYTELQENN